VGEELVAEALAGRSQMLCIVGPAGIGNGGVGGGGTALAAAPASVSPSVGTEVELDGQRFTLRHGSVIIAAITSCTNTSNPGVMLGAGLVARKAHARGKAVHVWTVNDALGMTLLASRGVDSIITDDPALAHKVIAWRQDLNPAERAILTLAYWFGITPPAADVATDVG